MAVTSFLGLFAPTLAAGCSSSLGARGTEYPPDENPSVEGGDYHDPCPGYERCACAEGTGWVPGPAMFVGDRFVVIGNRRINFKRELFTVKETSLVGELGGIFRPIMSIATIFPQIDFQFKLGSAEPKNLELFQTQTSHLTDELLKVITRQYPCVRERYGQDPVVYISGHTDRLGSEEYNLRLSKERALKVAQGVMYWLRVNRRQLKQPVTIEYAGLGEKEAKAKGDLDETPNEKGRRVDVVVTTVGKPFQANWQTLGRVEPLF